MAVTYRSRLHFAHKATHQFWRDKAEEVPTWYGRVVYPISYAIFFPISYIESFLELKRNPHNGYSTV